jgi:hypothetical protein
VVEHDRRHTAQEEGAHVDAREALDVGPLVVVEALKVEGACGCVDDDERRAILVDQPGDDLNGRRRLRLDVQDPFEVAVVGAELP